MPRGSPTSDSGERYTHERSLSTSVACFLRSLARWRSAGPLAPEQCLFSGCSASACEASESGGGAVSWDRVGLPAAQDIAVDTPESCDDSGIGSNAGNVSPLTSRAQHIHDAIHQVAHIDLGSTAAASRRRDLDHSASVRSLGYLGMIAIVSRGSPPSTSAAPRFGLLPYESQPIHPIQGVSRRTLSQDGYELEQAELKPSPHNPAGFI
jgi:hypothetical protein